eukprot:TRINITY_DN456_c0_g1_i3.p2 TRINITY_DN456_c0_g1~~TRINITY_DN456_c0_g1_i3.p2  ORF type:complete len:162 (-),score=17.44 TRINITY_DN456_c0_g1_i3:230-715(-)
MCIRDRYQRRVHGDCFCLIPGNLRRNGMNHSNPENQSGGREANNVSAADTETKNPVQIGNSLDLNNDTEAQNARKVLNKQAEIQTRVLAQRMDQYGRTMPAESPLKDDNDVEALLIVCTEEQHYCKKFYGSTHLGVRGATANMMRLYGKRQNRLLSSTIIL